MEEITAALESSHNDLKDMSSTLAFLNKIIPSAYYPEPLQGIRHQLDDLSRALSNPRTKNEEISFPIIPHHVKNNSTYLRKRATSQIYKYSSPTRDIVNNPSMLKSIREKFSIMNGSIITERNMGRLTYVKPKFIRISKKANVVPKESRIDPINYPPIIDNDELNDKGVISLVYKGVFSKKADLMPILDGKLPPLSLNKLRLQEGSYVTKPVPSPRTCLKSGFSHNDGSLTSENTRESPIVHIEIASPEIVEIAAPVEEAPIKRVFFEIKKGKLRENRHLSKFKEKYPSK